MDELNDNYFQVSVKGLFFNEANELMMILEEGTMWEVPGGRIKKGEKFIECLKREVLEETGIECEVLEEQPSIVYPTIDLEGRPRIMVYFKIKMKGLELVPSSEAFEIKFFKKEEIANLNTYPQIKPLAQYL